MECVEEILGVMGNRLEEDISHLLVMVVEEDMGHLLVMAVMVTAIVAHLWDTHMALHPDKMTAIEVIDHVHAIVTTTHRGVLEVGLEGRVVHRDGSVIGIQILLVVVEAIIASMVIHVMGVKGMIEGITGGRHRCLPYSAQRTHHGVRLARIVGESIYSWLISIATMA